MNQIIAEQKERVKNMEKTLERLTHVRHHQHGVRPEHLVEIRQLEKELRVERETLAKLQNDSEV